MSQQTIDAQNSSFWSELCGTRLAKAIGVSDNDRDSLKHYDESYFKMYPYLKTYVPRDEIRGKEVLEIGLGYGTLSQYLAECGAIYHGLDIASEPVEMVNHRLALLEGAEGLAQVGSALDIPHADNSLDFVYSIGCLHHTGDLQRCVDELYRVLKPGGRACVMIYNLYSFRLMTTYIKQKLHSLVKKSQVQNVAFRDSMRVVYDANAEGDAAPYTDYTSKREVKQIFARFQNVRVDKQNCDPIPIWRGKHIPRERLLSNLGRWAGLDLYASAEKRAA